MAGGVRDCNVFWEVKGLAPVDNLSVGVVRVFGAEGWPADQTFEHDGPNGPPVAAERVPVAREDLRRDIIRRPNGRVCHDSSRLAPGVDLAAIAHRKIDLIEIDRGAVVLWF